MGFTKREKRSDLKKKNSIHFMDLGQSFNIFGIFFHKLIESISETYASLQVIKHLACPIRELPCILFE